MIDDNTLNKTAIIRRCLQRVGQQHRGDPARLDEFTIQDSVIFNILQACEAAIDFAMHRVAQGRLGIPQSNRDTFEILYQNHLVNGHSHISMKSMVGFRNISVHSYQNIQIPILEAIVSGRLNDFEDFIGEIQDKPEPPFL